jgi:hypothetical protein
VAIVDTSCDYGPTDRLGRFLDFSPIQHEKRETGLGVMAVLVRSIEGLLGRLEVAHSATHLTDLVMSSAQIVGEVEPLQLRTCATGLVFCL